MKTSLVYLSSWQHRPILVLILYGHRLVLKVTRQSLYNQIWQAQDRLQIWKQSAYGQGDCREGGQHQTDDSTATLSFLINVIITPWNKTSHRCPIYTGGYIKTLSDFSVKDINLHLPCSRFSSLNLSMGRFPVEKCLPVFKIKEFDTKKKTVSLVAS